MQRLLLATICLAWIVSANACSSDNSGSTKSVTSKNAPSSKTQSVATAPKEPLGTAPVPPSDPPSPYIDPQSDEGKKWAATVGSVSFVLGYEKGRALAEETGKPAMFFVTTTWCGWCKRMAKDNFDNDSIKKLLESFVCVLVDGDTERVAAARLGASGYPHVAFRSHTGTQIGSVKGAKSSEEFGPILKRVLEAAKLN